MYGPLGDGWLAMPPEGTPKARGSHTAVSTGSRMIIWGGTSPNCGSGGGVCSDGAAYDPATDTWAPLRTEGAPSARSEHMGLWTGNALFISGEAWGRRLGCPLSDGALWVP
ncbi:kelch repeat-containing protein [Corallococcus sp. AB011P]|uniref:kelch repeat-containing protein n=1 Tax=Corallococcus sp. AB011P TaxID=2316735 RepID=UPI0011C34766|nr:kelch repeat-containing protein [Corallococcus sp. AB011P]